MKRLAVAGVVLAVVLLLGALPDGLASTSDNPAALIDSLLLYGQADSAKVLIDHHLAAARAADDSLLLGQMLASAVGYELTGGSVENAAALLDECLQVVVAQRDTATWARALRVGATMATNRGAFAEARELLDESLTMSRAVGNRRSEAVAMMDIGVLHARQRQWAEAMQQLSAAEPILRDLDPVYHLSVLSRIGLVLAYTGRADSSRVVFEDMLEIARATDQKPQEAEAMQSLGVLEYRGGDVGKAAQYFQFCYEYHRDAGHAKFAMRPAGNLAETLLYLGRKGEADALLREAIVIADENAYDRDKTLLMATLVRVQLADEQWRAAAATSRRVLSYGGATHGQARSAAVLTLAATLVAMDSTSAATSYLAEHLADNPHPAQEPSLAMLLAQCYRLQGRNDEAVEAAARSLAAAEKLGDLSIMLAATFELSRCYREAGQGESAFAAFEDGVSLLQQKRGAQEGHEWREATGGTPVMVSASRILMEQPAETPHEVRIAGLFDVLQRFKARTLLERMVEPRSLGAASAELSAVPSVSIEQLQETALSDGDLFLDFIVGDSETYLFAITTNDARMVLLPGMKSELREQCELFVGVVSDANGDAGVIEQGAAALGENILAEVDDLLARSHRIIVSPDAFFNAVPFAVLAVNGTPLIESFTVTRTPSAAVLAAVRSRAVEPPLAPRVAAVVDGASGLKGARAEVDFLRKRYDGVEVLGDARAAPTMDVVLQSHDVIHVAAHVRVDDENPWYSGVLINEAQAELRSGEVADDPYLRAGTIAGWRIPARLAVLAACESAGGRITQGEGVLGLTAAFLSAGSSTVVGTLWRVDDRVTERLTKAFYRGLEDGVSAAEALRAAQLSVRQESATSAPYYWAGFVTVGDGGTRVLLEGRGGNDLFLYLGLVAILLLALTVALSRRRAKG